MFYIFFNEKTLNKKLIYNVIIKKNKRQISLKGYIDTGNTLCDIMTGKSVILCEFEKVKILFDDNLKDCFEKDNCLSFEKLDEKIIKKWGIRFIPFCDYSGNGILTAFTPDKVIINYENKKITFEDVLVGIRLKSFEKQYSVLLNQNMVLN
ncbi:MAG: sigma-E processing peptidase SpoIIGA [Clostridia bacterium]